MQAAIVYPSGRVRKKRVSSATSERPRRGGMNHIAWTDMMDHFYGGKKRTATP